MSSSKHTPGPWELDDSCEVRGYHPVLTIEDRDGNEIAEAIFWTAPAEVGGQDESWANARLIAAAPDYDKAADEALAALYGAREVLGSIANIQLAIDLLTAARAKARGE